MYEMKRKSPLLSSPLSSRNSSELIGTWLAFVKQLTISSIACTSRCVPIKASPQPFLLSWAIIVFNSRSLSVSDYTSKVARQVRQVSRCTTNNPAIPRDHVSSSSLVWHLPNTWHSYLGSCSNSVAINQGNSGPCDASAEPDTTKCVAT